MSAERNLQTLLQHMQPEMQDGVFVFATLPDDEKIADTINPLLTFREREGTTLVLRRDDADSIGLSWQFASRLITLNVHSALDAVGFLAAVTARLADAGISVNAVSAFHHDHLFVPVEKADEALALLRDMSCRAGS
ncbi:ribonuclease H [Bradyrhizobium guangdongense]|uniref:ACT domain-containing protein n=1 Tax=Bradyrhizobium guangdongense TaxID=1325090 RepID=UPI00112EC807|nr:ACT domain-containing protein [Bradyrhizobium guangdongense]TPQ41270.1 ribonuclease H [Bradyrhizobium guangdongense]